VDQFAAQFALDESAMRKVVHDAQEGDGYGKGEEGGEVGVYQIILIDFYALTQNAAFQRGIIINRQSAIVNP
jgi:hypothetical protein